jgi:23S rRNA pseudouridine2605 synthase
MSQIPYPFWFLRLFGNELRQLLNDVGGQKFYFGLNLRINFMNSEVIREGMIRLQVFLSHQGVCSRRKAMDYIQHGRVKVNGQIVREPSTQVHPSNDRIEVDGKSVQEKTYDYILLNKPAGIVVTRQDRFAPMTVLDLLPKHLQHLHPVGRLDKDTEGLLLLTNDGELTHRLTHPRFEVQKVYFVTVEGCFTAEKQRQVERGILIEGKQTASAVIRLQRQTAKETDFLLTIHEGRKRQVRLMMVAMGHRVVYLKRIQQGPLALGDLKTGCFRSLKIEEVEQLKKSIGMKKD